jgi:hypothetical protein
MRFDDAASWIVGQPGKGLNAMFVMMNAARLHVAMQGIGLLDAAWQKADAYARERRQMRAPGRRASPAEADFIIEHPAVRRMLDTQRAWVDGGRVLAYRTGLELDRIRHGDAEQSTAAQRWCALVTPVLKAAWTHQAFHGGSECLQVFGGHGYVREWGIEQILRDARVAMIYEGTNEIQAIDLLARKIVPDGAATLYALLDDIASDLDAAGRSRLEQFRTCTTAVVQTASHHATLPFQVADDYLRAFTLVLLDWAWQRIDAQLPADTLERAARWEAPAQALRTWVLPEGAMRVGIIDSIVQAAAQTA